MTSFTDGELGVFSSTRVLFDCLPVLLVFHDKDGEWQFLSSYEEEGAECRLVHVAHLLDSDDSLDRLADLPVGWKAWRWSIDEAWVREPIPPDQESVSE